jgi:hypothetical protein
MGALRSRQRALSISISHSPIANSLAQPNQSVQFSPSHPYEILDKTPLVAFLLIHGPNPNLDLHGEEFPALEMAPKANTDVEITSLLLQHGAVV